MRYLAFEEARTYVRNQKLENTRAWKKWSKGILEGKERRPDFIPASPDIVYKNSVKQKPKREFTDSLSTKEDRYKSDKKIIEDAMVENDLETLEAMSRDRRVKEFPDLIKMIEEALKNK